MRLPANRLSYPEVIGFQKYGRVFQEFRSLTVAAPIRAARVSKLLRYVGELNETVYLANNPSVIVTATSNAALRR